MRAGHPRARCPDKPKPAKQAIVTTAVPKTAILPWARGLLRNGRSIKRHETKANNIDTATIAIRSFMVRE
jgi:hypothetical protein